MFLKQIELFLDSFFFNNAILSLEGRFRGNAIE